MWIVMWTSGYREGLALWLGAGLCIFPALDISPLRMMGLFYAGAGISQGFAGGAMLACNILIRRYWAKSNPAVPAAMLGNTTHVQVASGQGTVYQPPAVRALFIMLHANNEADFSFLVDATVAAFMCLSKVAVTICARTVHRHLSPLSRQVAQEWVKVLAFSKALTAACACVLFFVYLAKERLRCARCR